MNRLNWLRREWQRYRASHLLIIATLVLGMGGVFLIERLKVAFLTSVKNQEKELLSSDFSVRARRPISADEEKIFFETLGAQLLDSYRILDMSSMLYAPKQNSSRLVEVRVIQDNFPFYGELATAQGPLELSASHPLFTEKCVWLHEEASRLLGVNLGDELRLGEGVFRACGVVTKDSTQGFRGFALAPRIYLGVTRLKETQLVGEGTIAAHSIHVRLKETDSDVVAGWQKDLEKRFDDPAIKTSRPEDTSEQTARSGKLFGDYLQLASLVALILAVVGTFYLFRTLVHRRLKDVAILRALGISSLKARELLLLPLILDFLAALPLAALFSALVFPLVTEVLAQLFSTVLPLTNFPWSVTGSLPMILAMLIASLMPAVEEAVRAPVMGLLQDQEKRGVVPWRFSVLYVVFGLASLVALAIWAAHSIKIGTLFVVGLFVAVGLLAGVSLLARFLGEVLLRRASSLSSGAGLMVGLVVRRLLRRPITTLLSVIALGLGSVLISLLGHLELSLGQEFNVSAAEKPALFLFDIQDEQTENLRTYLAEKKVPLQALSPMVRGKLVSVNDEPFRKNTSTRMFQTREAETEDNFRQRMMNLSWAEGLNGSERLIEGVPFAQAKLADGEAPLSLEVRFAQRLGIKLGDLLTFEILGVPLAGRVVNIRSVKWTSFRPNFFITFAPGYLEDAPKSWLAAVGELGAAEKAALQNDMARRFPNISAIDVGQLTVRLLELFGRLKQALQLMAFFAFVVGIVVVTAMAQDQVIRRQAEVMLEKTLGLSPLRVTAMVFGEFLGLALVAFTLGGVAGAGISGILTVFVFEGEMIWSFGLLFSLTFGGMLLVSLPLVVLARRIFNWRPAGLFHGA